MTDRLDSAARYRVVVNDEQQYSLWAADRELPAGWLAEGTEGDREQCLAHIATVWTDMTPLSVRTRLNRARS